MNFPRGKTAGYLLRKYDLFSRPRGARNQTESSSNFPRGKTAGYLLRKYDLISRPRGARNQTESSLSIGSQELIYGCLCSERRMQGNNRVKKVMILGAGAGQVPFIEICKNRNYYVIVVSPDGNYPGFMLADKCFFLDTRDKFGILEVALSEKPDAIMSDQTDVSVPSVAYVSGKLGLKSIGCDTARYFSDKYLMREKAAELGIAVPEFAKASTFKEAKAALLRIGLPAMIKPVDSSGSRGVHRINSIEELEYYFKRSISFSYSKSVIVEQFIEGKEYIADGLAIDRQYINTDLGIKEYFDKPGCCISKMCMFSSALSIDDPVELSVLKTNKSVVEGFGLPFGITHGEYIVSNVDGKAYLVEIAARGGGVFLSSDLTPRACGIDTNELLIDYIVENKRVAVSELSLRRGVAAFMCFELQPGTIKEIRGRESLNTLPGVFKAFVEDLSVGAMTCEMTDDSNKKGPILIEACSREECYRYIRQVKDTFDVIVDNGGVESHIIW